MQIRINPELCDYCKYEQLLTFKLCLILQQMCYSNVTPYEMESSSIKLPPLECI